MARHGSVRTTMQPGDPGTRRLLEKYGPSLVCVRYRYDKEKRERVTTVEIVVDRGSWAGRDGLEPWTEVGIRLRYAETELRERAREAGARWDPTRKLWWMRWDVARRTGLAERVAAWQES